MSRSLFPVAFGITSLLLAFLYVSNNSVVISCEPTGTQMVCDARAAKLAE